MRFECKKTEDCFAASLTWEYRLPISSRELEGRLTGWTVAENHRYRRALMTADKGAVNIKGILDSPVIKVSYPENGWEAEKAAFESWLTSEADNG